MEKELLNPDRALKMILASVSPLGVEQVELRNAFGRVMAEEVSADLDLPPFDNSAMDGYAVITEDVRGATSAAPITLKVIAEQPAGRPVAGAVTPGTAVKIMTGAPVPQGADTVVIVEHTKASDGQVTVFVESRIGENIRRAGEDVRRGDVVLRTGVRIGPAELAMLASVGCSNATVYRRPTVAIITTGDELVDIDETPGPGKIRDSNQYSIFGQVVSANCEVNMIRRCTDEREHLSRTLIEAAEVSDLILTTGGVSVGDYDLVKETLDKLGEIRFWKVAVKPGKPLAYGDINGKPVFGLPGNGVSSMVAFDVFVRPALAVMSGSTSRSMVVKARIAEAIKHKAGRREFVRAKTIWDNDGFLSTPTGNQGSGRLKSMLGANSYIIISESIDGLSSGDVVNVMFMDWGLL